jgi:CheY-like chemotaxis protein
LGIGRGAVLTIRLPTVERQPMREDSESPAAKSQSRKRVLIVDDNRDAADALSEILELEGQEVKTAYDAAAAIEIASRFGPHLILLDIGLPQTDGYELARQIRQMPGLNKVSLIAVTGYGQPKYKERAERMGFDYYMVKPVDLEQLSRIIAATPDRGLH